MNNINTLVGSVDKNSFAERAGIEKGDTILKINDNDIYNILEYRYLCAESEVTLLVQKANGEKKIIFIENNYEDLGINFSEELIAVPQSCKNKCIFCFIDQLPKGMRETVYFKDDDTRLSFLQGNYVTLTNMSDFDIDRLIKFRISPINVSVHTTNPKLREFMLNNKFAGKILEIMKKFRDNEIYMNCQIVLCPEINDGDELYSTLSDLSSLYPYVGSISVVPVGLSEHRQNLYPLKAFTDKSASIVIDEVEKLQNYYLKKYGSRIVYLSDEFYIMAKRVIPNSDCYEGFPQIENGVGIIASMNEEINWAIEKIQNNKRSRTVSIITGEISYDTIRSWADLIEKKAEGVKVFVYAVKNKFFGGKVSVSGLVCGGDIIEQLSGIKKTDALLIPSCMLRSEDDVFLDDTTVSQVENALGMKITTVQNDGFDFTEKILGEEIEF